MRLQSDLTEELETLERDLEASGSAMAAFSKELSAARAEAAAAGQQIAGLRSGISSGLKGAIDGIVLDGARLSDVLGGVVRSIIDAAYSAAVRPVAEEGGNALAGGIEALVAGISRMASGSASGTGRIVPFAKGGVVSGPAVFPMRGATGLMGEAGPEAIMPLVRGADGRLGVQSMAGGRTVNVTVNVSTPDVEGFRRSRTQIAAQMQRAISLGQRNR